MLNDATGFDKIFIATGYTDLRRGIDGLASTIKYQFELDPFQKNILFLFSKGFCLYLSPMIIASPSIPLRRSTVPHAKTTLRIPAASSSMGHLFQNLGKKHFGNVCRYRNRAGLSPDDSCRSEADLSRSNLNLWIRMRNGNLSEGNPALRFRFHKITLSSLHQFICRLADLTLP